MYEIHGGDMSKLSFVDGGAMEFLESHETEADAKEALKDWHKQGYAALIKKIDTEA